ncbi:flagellar hook-associated protein 3 [Aquaspirillum sp. LM1]|uniref:flagellar hook-associated protein FlgL n=1 Tax=Aquaspirillum sp. LM1 TaxID=1938604 RepID=UPI000983DAFA|nr:flagellar hook-associated protein FlgL [Aquaspirillum sp. LM1]AQR65295.1 flagellar hook-associated protein 3 [Aquaspirillum sp. LM1]
MRVSTNSLYLNNLSNMMAKQNALNKTQEQLSSMRRVNSPSDDPVAASQILDQTQADSRIQQFNQNAKSAESALALTEVSLQSAGDLLQRVREMAVKAGNTALTNDDRKMLNSELEGLYKQLLGTANTLDGNGKALFGGSISQTKPFSELVQFGTAVAAGSSVVQYNGDANRQEMLISSSRQVPVTENGDYAFGRITEGNGVFKLGAGSTLSNVQVDLGSVTNLSAFEAQTTPPLALPSGSLSQPGAKIEVVFGSEDDGVAGTALEFNQYYDVVLFDGVSYTSLVTGKSGATQAAASDLYTATAEQVASGNPALGPFAKSYPKFQTGTDITLNFPTNPAPYDINYGAKFSVASEKPTAGGVLTLEPSKSRSIFDTLNDLSRVLQSDVATPATSTDFANRLGNVIANIDNAQTRLLTVEARIGANRREADTLVEVGDNFSLQYKAILSRLQDVDVASAATELSLAKVALEASQSSFAKIQGMTLFNYI